MGRCGWTPTSESSSSAAPLVTSFARRMLVEVEGLDVPFIDAESLVANKKASGPGVAGSLCAEGFRRAGAAAPAAVGSIR